MIITRSREFKINMGNYESHGESMTVAIDTEQEGLDFKAALSACEERLREGLRDTLKRAAKISDVRNTYILTWLEEECLEN